MFFSSLVEKTTRLSLSFFVFFSVAATIQGSDDTASSDSPSKPHRYDNISKRPFFCIGHLSSHNASPVSFVHRGTLEGASFSQEKRGESHYDRGKSFARRTFEQQRYLTKNKTDALPATLLQETLSVKNNARMNDLLQCLQIVATSVDLRCQLLSRNSTCAVPRAWKVFKEGCFCFRIRNENVVNEGIRTTSMHAKTRKNCQRKRLAGSDRSCQRNDTHEISQFCSSLAAVVRRNLSEMSGATPNHFSNEAAA